MEAGVYTTEGANSTQNTPEDGTDAGGTGYLAGLQTGLLYVQVMEGLLILLANSLTVMTIVRIPSLRTNTHRYILCLTVADMVASLIPPLSLVRYYVKAESPLWSSACFLERLLQMLCLSGNMVYALCVTVDRHIGMAYPFRYDVLMTHARVSLTIAATWCFLVVQAILVGVLQHTQMTRDCYASSLLVLGTYYLVITSELCVFLVLTLLFVVKYLVMSWKQARQTGAWQGTVAVAGGDNKDMTNMMSGVVSIHALCLTPALTCGALSWGVAAGHVERVLDTGAATLLLANSWVKPLVYYCRNEQYRLAYKDNWKDLLKGQFAPRPTPPRVITAPP